MIYFDQSATSLHKPAQVVTAVQQALSSPLGNPARGAHEAALSALKAQAQARRTVAAFFGAEPLSLGFTQNATLALNLAVKGALSKKDRVLTTQLEHNSLLRPLYQLQDQGMALSLVPLQADGTWGINEFKTALTPDTTAVCVNAMSNITGQAAPLTDLIEICVQRDLLLILDLSQYAGTRPLPPVRRWPRALLSFTGHKSLYGPPGSGGLITLGGASLRPVIVGGSGVHSFDRVHPSNFPEVCEAGTPNLPAILGLAAGIRWIIETGQEHITKHLSTLRRLFVQGLAGIPGAVCYAGGSDPGPVVACNLGGWDSASLSQALDARYHIATRPGAHCAPLWHRFMNLTDRGAVRFSFSFFNTQEEVDIALAALRELAGEGRG